MIKKLIKVSMLAFALILAACGDQQEIEIEAEPNVEISAVKPTSTPEPILQTSSWQEAYAALLRHYETILIQEWNNNYPNGYFFLHDIDGDGIPELFIFEEMTYLRGIEAYTFRNGTAIRLEHHEFGGLFGSFSAIPEIEGIVEFHAVGSGGRYRRIMIDDDRIFAASDGFMTLSEAGREKSDADYWPLGLEWYYLTINGEAVTVEEFEAEFGVIGWESIWLRDYPINEASIQSIIFGMPAFALFEGTIIDIQSLTNDKTLVSLESYPDNDERIDFIIDQNSLVISGIESAIETEIGLRANVFYETRHRHRNSHFLPQIHARAFVLPYVITSSGLQLVSGAGTILGHFDEDWNYISRDFEWFSEAQLVISVVNTEGVEIVLQDGSPFDGDKTELAGRPLLVSFDSRIRYTFPQVLPTKIYVLFP